MPDFVVDPEQRELAQVETLITEALARLRNELEAAAGDAEVPAIDPEYVNRWVETARRMSVQVSNDLPPTLEPAAVAEIRKIIINMLDDLEHVDAARPLDAIDQFCVGSEAIRHIIRDALDEHVGCPENDARPLVASLKQALPRIRQTDQARLAGISTRHLQRLSRDGGPAPRQLVLAVHLVKLLRYVWNPEGVIAWFHRERAALDEHAPIDVAGNPEFERLLLRLARQGRAQHGA